MGVSNIDGGWFTPLLAEAPTLSGWLSRHLRKYAVALSERVDQYTKSQPIHVALHRKLVALLYKAISCVTQFLAAPPPFLKLLRAVRAFFECHGFGRPPDSPPTAKWPGPPWRVGEDAFDGSSLRSRR